MKRGLLFHSLIIFLALALGVSLIPIAAYLLPAGPYTLAIVFGIWLVGALAVVALALYWYKLQIQRPLDALMEATAAVSRGDLATHVTLSERSELGQLAASFNAMVETREAYDKALRDTKEKYRQLVEQIPAVIYRSTAERHKSALFVNPEIRELLGYSPQEWLSNGGLWYECLHPDDRAQVMDALRHLRASDGALQLEYRMYARDGRLIWVRDTVRALSRHNGKPPLLQGVLIDMTAHKVADEKLVYQAMLPDYVQDAIIATAVDHKIIFWNRAAADLYGWSAQEALGEYLDTLMPAETQRTSHNESDAVQPAFAKHYRKTGEPLRVEITLIPLQDADGNLNGYLRVVRAANAPRNAASNDKATDAFPTIPHAQSVQPA